MANGQMQRLDCAPMWCEFCGVKKFDSIKMTRFAFGSRDGLISKRRALLLLSPATDAGTAMRSASTHRVTLARNQ